MPVVAAVVEHRGCVVLARNKLWPPKLFGLITGFLEREDPDPRQGVLREVEEELGLRGEVVGFIGHYPFPQKNQLIIAFHVVADGDIHLGEELAEYRRIAPEKLRPWSGATGAAVRDWLIGRGLQPAAAPPRVYDLPAFVVIGPSLATSGQPRREQFALLAAAGYEAVINLARADSPGALADEAEIVQALGLRYHHQPVDFAAPRAEDFARFCAAMRVESGRRVLVHCAANRRASAFVYLWRRLVQGEPETAAREALERVWQPQGVWAEFIDRQLQAGLPES